MRAASLSLRAAQERRAATPHDSIHIFTTSTQQRLNRTHAPTKPHTPPPSLSPHPNKKSKMADKLVKAAFKEG